MQAPQWQLHVYISQEVEIALECSGVFRSAGIIMFVKRLEQANGPGKAQYKKLIIIIRHNTDGCASSHTDKHCTDGCVSTTRYLQRRVQPHTQALYRWGCNYKHTDRHCTDWCVSTHTHRQTLYRWVCTHITSCKHAQTHTHMQACMHMHTHTHTHKQNMHTQQH